MRFNIKAFALTCALFWSLSIFAMTWWFIVYGGPIQEFQILGDFYRGFSVSPLGSLIGSVWAFFDALVLAAAFAWLYNKLAAKLLD